MGGLLRTSLFPLIVVVLLVYLASQTLMGNGEETTKVTYSELVARVRAETRMVTKVVFKPNRHEIQAQLMSGDDVEANYPTPRSQIEFEHFLSTSGVAYDFDWNETRTSPWWSLVTALLPFVLLFGFWIFLTNQWRDRSGRA